MRARVARKVLGLVDPPSLHRFDRGTWATNRLEPFPVTDVNGDPTLAAGTTDAVGIDLRVDEQLERLAGWGRRGPEVFAPIRADRLINLTGPTAGPIANVYYSTPDAEVYASIILDLQPRRIVEIGGGFSTLVARHAITAAGSDTSLVVVDPEPRTEIARAASEVLRRRVETMSPEELVVGEGEVLFIDSSHVIRTGGDLPFLFLEVLPRLPSGAVVHVHDIYLPYGYASDFAQRFWTEQYLLQALLTGSDRYEVLFATHLMSRRHVDEMRAVFGPHVGAADGPSYGQSFWLRIR